ncbi:hypothetical protein C8F01DRAFT_1105423 [Mycena amicta]|nr:hypothetical protein C8F01DRAFT_1105423 [Mycena amicta]
MSTHYFQVGGVKGHIYSQTLADIVYDALSRDGTLEILLGIKLSGTSHLLVGEEDMRRLCAHGARCNRNSNQAAADSKFESISPIVFKDRTALDKKLEDLAQKRGSGNVSVDLSRANKSYQDPSSTQGIDRGQFENARLLYRLLSNPQIAPTYNVDLMAESPAIPIFCFAFNLWNADTRPKEKRVEEPRVLDLAWGEAPAPGMDADAMKTASHIRFKKQQHLRNARGQKEFPRKDFEWSEMHGPTEILLEDEIKVKIQKFFEPFSRRTQTPAVLLVHNKSAARDILDYLGVDNSHWEWSDSSLKRLLRELEPIMPIAQQPRQEPGDLRRRPDDRRPTRDRSRSHVRPNPRALPVFFAPLYVIDVQSLFTTLFKTPTDSDSLPSIMQHTGLYPVADCNGWCAGNELWMLNQVFCAMAEKGGVDDQVPSEWPDLGLGHPPPAVEPGEAPDYNYDDVSDYGSEED